MTPRSFLLTQELSDYVRAGSEPPDDVAADLLAETAAMAERGEAPATFQIAAEQGAFMQSLTRALGVRTAIEIGTFTGFSALAISRGLPDDGELICLDVSDEWTSIGRKYWERAGVAGKIDLRIGDAHESAARLDGEFDLAFVDADKDWYIRYFETVLPLIRPNGLLLFDNTLAGGRVIDEDGPADRKEFNAHVAQDDRVDVIMLGIGDGLTLVRKK